MRQIIQELYGMKQNVSSTNADPVHTFMLIMGSAEAQRGRGRQTRGNTNTPVDTTKQNQNVQQNTNPATISGYNPYGNIPIKMAPSIGGFEDNTKPSLRRDAAVEKGMFKD